MVITGNEAEIALAVGVAQGKHEIVVPLADLRREEMHPGSPQVFTVLWGDYLKRAGRRSARLALPVPGQRRRPPDQAAC